MDKRTDWKRFVAIINAADENCEKPRSKEAIALMFEVLKGYEVEEIAQAVQRLMLDSPYRIKPADIARVIGGTPSDKSALAWQIFKNALLEHGSFDSVAFPDPAYHWVICRMGGWERLAKDLEQLDDRELSFREKDWRQLYERGLNVASFEDDPGHERVPRYLWGECERNNREGGWSLEHTPIHEIGTGRRLDRERLAALSAGTGTQIPALLGETMRRLTA